MLVAVSAWAGCLPDHGTVIVVLHNRDVDEMTAMGGPLVDAVTLPVQSEDRSPRRPRHVNGPEVKPLAVEWVSLP